jgi:hypothetical protein
MNLSRIETVVCPTGLHAILIEDFNKEVGIVATVNFSVPEKIKKTFNETFAGENKSAIIARLMLQAVDEAKRQRRREEAFRLLTEKRRHRKPMTDEDLLKTRQSGRP